MSKLEFGSAFCKTCNAQRKVSRNCKNHILHLLLTLVTFGVWLIVWGLLSMFMEPWHCDTCGTKI